MLEVMYEAPGNAKFKKVTVTEDMVEDLCK